MSAAKGYSFRRAFLKRFCKDRLALAGVCFVVLLVLTAIYAPLLANGVPLMVISRGELSFPAWRSFFAPDSPEAVVECIFNFLLFFLPDGIQAPKDPYRYDLRTRALHCRCSVRVLPKI